LFQRYTSIVPASIVFGKRQRDRDLRRCVLCKERKVFSFCYQKKNTFL